MRFPPSVWGPIFWHTIHVTALSYPSNPTYAQKKAAKEYYESLTELIPCPICREHYKVHLQKLPLTPHLDRREDLFRWTVELHNEVNTMLGKPTVTEMESINFYRRIGARERSPFITPVDLEEIDARSMLKGALIGAAVVGVAGGLLWWSTRGEKVV
jgi:hypothetical protein